MDIFNVPLLYSKFRKNILKKPYKLLGVTKNLTISKNSYTNFYKSSINIFQKKTFKIPEQTEYPLLRESQGKYISLKTRLNTFSFRDKKNKPNIIIPLSSKQKIQKIFSEKKFKKSKKNINFFICDNDYNNTKNGRNICTENDIIKKKINAIKKHHPPDFFLSINYFKYAEPVDEVKNPEERIQNFFMLLNSIFKNENYMSLNYNEKEIFGHKDEYIKFIKDEFNYFRNEEKEIKMKYYLFQTIKTKGYGIMDLYLKSARIDIIDDSLINNNVIKSITIPFDLMCMIYLCNMKQILQIIFYFLNKINFNDKDIIISEQTLKNIFSEIISKMEINDDKTNNEYGNLKFNLKHKNYEKYTTRIFYLKSIVKFSDNNKYNSLISAFLNKENSIKIINSNNFKLTKNILNKKRILFNNNVDYYKLLLIHENKKYNIKFSMPEISLIFRDYEKQLNHCIDKELLIYLYQNNFNEWDFYILHYLYYKQGFRRFIGRNLSLRNNLNLFLRKNIINENNKFEFKDSKQINDSEIYNNILQALNNPWLKYYLNNFYTTKININEDDYKFIFSIINGNNFNIYRFKSYTLYVFINSINKPEIYEFKFNFRQMKVLYYRSKFDNFKLFLNRLIIIKKNSIFLDYSYFDSFYSMTNKEIYEFFFKLDQNNKEQLLKEEIKHNSLILKMREPHFEVMLNEKNESNRLKIKQYRIELNKKFFAKLMENDVNDWMKIIFENKDYFSENNYRHYEEYKFKIFKKKSIIIK